VLFTLESQWRSPKWPSKSNLVRPRILLETGNAELNIRNIMQLSIIIRIVVDFFLGNILLKNGML
jgi:hypothetical protein